MKESKDDNQKWFSGICDAIEKIDSTHGMNASQLSAWLLMMATNSVKNIKIKIIASTEQLTDDTRERIAEGYINLLNETKNTVLKKFASDSSKGKYSLTEQDIRTLRKYFFNILKDKFTNNLLVELFLSNYMVCSFGAVINAFEHKHLVELEKEKMKAN